MAQIFECSASDLHATYSLTQRDDGSWYIRAHSTGYEVWNREACSTTEAIEAAEYDGFEFDIPAFEFDRIAESGLGE